jgi:hypothetical protein
MASVIPQTNVFIPRHSEVYGRVNSEARNRRKWHEKICFTKNPAPENRKDSMYLSKTCFGTEFREFASIFFYGTEFLVFFSSAEQFGTEFQEFSIRQIVPNGIPRVFFYFCFIVQNSKHFSPLRNGSERNYENFLFRRTAGIPPEQTNCSVY